MITKKTILILGAGASMPYKFPSGSGLKSEIYGLLKNSSGAKNSVFHTFGFDKQLVEEFSDSLNYSPLYSIDAFLENRPEFSEIGKAAIAYQLIKRESESNIFDNDDWYQYLFNCLGNNPKTIFENKLTIFTYNYDRSLEYFLYRSLSKSYNFDSEKIQIFFENIKIIHLHGSLGELPCVNASGRPYDTKISKEIILQGLKHIKIIHEGDVSEAYEPAYEYLDKAEIVVFLGFGYNEINLERIFSGDWNKENTWIGGTAKGLTEMEIRPILQKYDHNLSIDGTDQTVMQFLRRSGAITTNSFPYVEFEVEKEFPIKHSIVSNKTS